MTEDNQRDTIAIHNAALHAAASWATKDATRYVLTSVCIKPSPSRDGWGTVTATDGRRLVVIHTPAAVKDAEGHFRPFAPFLIPAEAIAKLPKNRAADALVSITREQLLESGDLLSLVDSANGLRVETKEPDAVFPNTDAVCCWRPPLHYVNDASNFQAQSIPSPLTGRISINPDYLADAGKLSKIFCARKNWKGYGSVTMNVHSIQAPLWGRIDGRDDEEAFFILMPVVKGESRDSYAERDEMTTITRPAYTEKPKTEDAETPATQIGKIQ